MPSPTTLHPTLAAIAATTATVACNRILAAAPDGLSALVQHWHPGSGSFRIEAEFLIRQATTDGTAETFRHALQNWQAERVVREHGDSAAAIAATLRMLWGMPDPIAIERGRAFGDLLFTPSRRDLDGAPMSFGGKRPTSVRFGGELRPAIFSRPAYLHGFAHHVEAEIIAPAAGGRIALLNPTVLQGDPLTVGDGWWIAHHPGGPGQRAFGPFDFEPRDY